VKKGRFLDLRDPSQLAAFATVRNLVAEYDEDIVRRAFAEVVSAGKLKRWTEGYRLTPTRGAQCPTRILGARCRPNGCPGCDLPVGDAGTLWSHGRKPVVFVTQPFGISPEKFSRLDGWCSTHRFACRIDAASSWHSPGGSLFVALAPQDGTFWKLEWATPKRKSVWEGAKR